MTEDVDARARWNARHAARDGTASPARFLTARAHLLPPGGRALDVAGGVGRNALWLAARGFAVTLLDVSDVAADRARDTAADAGLDVTTVRTEIAPGTLPAGPFDVVLVHHFLDRDVWAELPGKLAPGGVLLVCQPTLRNLERHPRPSRRWLLAEGEARRIADALTARDGDLEVVELEEGWTPEGRHEASLVVRRTPRSPETPAVPASRGAGRS